MDKSKTVTHTNSNDLVNKEAFKSIISLLVNDACEPFISTLPKELIIVSPHALSDQTLLLISHAKLHEFLDENFSKEFMFQHIVEENDSIDHLRLANNAGIIQYQIKLKNELVSGLTPNVDIMSLVREVRLFAPSSQPFDSTFSFGIEFSFNNVLCSEAYDTTDDSRVYGIVSYHPESETLDIHCGDLIDNDLSAFEEFQSVIKSFADVFFNHPTIPFSDISNMDIDIFSYPCRRQDYKEMLIKELAQL